jgi:hypothetical protein
MNADNYGDALDATLRRIEELEREKREMYCRFLGLLAELHADETLSEQQCATFLGVDLVTWRREEDRLGQEPGPHPFAQEGTW